MTVSVWFDEPDISTSASQFTLLSSCRFRQTNTFFTGWLLIAASGPARSTAVFQNSLSTELWMTFVSSISGQYALLLQPLCAGNQRERQATLQSLNARLGDEELAFQLYPGRRVDKPSCLGIPDRSSPRVDIPLVERIAQSISTGHEGSTQQVYRTSEAT